ncbi:MAG: ABC transporter ATP-binding protein, partial [Thiolinea sp.]
KVFLFDEPLSNLDAKLRVDMRTEIKKLHQRLGSTIVYVTHDQIEAMTLASKIAIMKGGVLQQLGSPDEVYNQPANMFVAGFMGSPSMNLIPAELTEDTNGQIAARVEHKAGSPMLLPVGDNPAYRDWVGKRVILGLRPETITDVGSAERDSSMLFEVSCQIDVTEPTGADIYALIELNGTDATGRMRANCGAQAGQVSPVVFNMAHAVLFDPESEARIG